MAAQTDGGPAFPVPNDANTNGQEGMTLRDWFAGQALVGLIGHGNSVVSDEYNPASTLGDIVAGHAYFLADAMLKERSK